ncbi:MAG: hypothetical protein ACP5KE_01875 [Candidatus Methanodesulfokora sp.]|jgi:hypothetical protein
MEAFISKVNSSIRTMLCTMCKAREAVYTRRYSGESLCEQCLRKSIIIKVRKTIGKLKLLERDDKILFISLGREIDEPAFQVLENIESNFPEVSLEILKLESPVEYSDVPYIIRKHNKQSTKIVLPIFLDDLIAIFFRYCDTGYPDLLLKRGRLVIAGEEMENVVSPYVEVISRELGIAWGVKMAENPYLKLVWELEDDTPGALYNIYHSYERIIQ